MTDGESLVRDTVLDYFEGWYTADRPRMERALHTDLVKRWAGDDQTPFGPIMTTPRMLDLTGAGEGKADRSPIDVRVVDVFDDIACAVVRSGPYREYLHLIRTPNGWRIVNALWQYQNRPTPA
jgi:hypothetical protein